MKTYRAVKFTDVPEQGVPVHLASDFEVESKLFLDEVYEKDPYELSWADFLKIFKKHFEVEK